MLLISSGLLTAQETVGPKVDANTLGGYYLSNFVQIRDINQTILGNKDFTGTLSFSGVSFPTSAGTTNQVLRVDGSGNLEFATISAFTGVLMIDASNMSYVKLLRASDTIVTNFDHDHSQYKLNTDYAFGQFGFADSTVTISATQNNYFIITNGTGLYTAHVKQNVDIVGDSVYIMKPGYYAIDWDLSFSGSNTDNYHISIFVNGVENSGNGEAIRDMTTTTKGVATGHFMKYLSVGDWVDIRIKNTANNNDPTVYAGNYRIEKLN